MLHPRCVIRELAAGGADPREIRPLDRLIWAQVQTLPLQPPRPASLALGRSPVAGTGSFEDGAGVAERLGVALAPRAKLGVSTMHLISFWKEPGNDLGKRTDPDPPVLSLPHRNWLDRRNWLANLRTPRGKACREQVEGLVVPRRRIRGK